MIRVLLFWLMVGIVAVGVVWLADRPGEVAITWQGWRLQTSVMVLAVMIALTALLSVLVWSTVNLVVGAPAHPGRAGA